MSTTCNTWITVIPDLENPQTAGGIRAMARLSSDDIIATGVFRNMGASHDDIRIARFNESGHFAKTGIGFGSNSNDIIHDMSIAPNNLTAIVGAINIDANTKGFLVVYNPQNKTIACSIQFGEDGMRAYAYGVTAEANQFHVVGNYNTTTKYGKIFHTAFSQSCAQINSIFYTVEAGGTGKSISFNNGIHTITGFAKNIEARKQGGSDNDDSLIMQLNADGSVRKAQIWGAHSEDDIGNRHFLNAHKDVISCSTSHAAHLSTYYDATISTINDKLQINQRRSGFSGNIHELFHSGHYSHATGNNWCVGNYFQNGVGGGRRMIASQIAPSGIQVSYTVIYTGYNNFGRGFASCEGSDGSALIAGALDRDWTVFKLSADGSLNYTTAMNSADIEYLSPESQNPSLANTLVNYPINDITHEINTTTTQRLNVQPWVITPYTVNIAVNRYPGNDMPCATPTPTASVSPTPSVTPTVSHTASVSPTHSPTPSNTASVSVTSTSTASVTSSATAAVTPSVTSSITSVPTASVTAAVSPSATGSGTPSSSNTAAATASGTPSTTAAVTASATGSSSPSSSNSAAATASNTPSTTAAVTASVTSSSSPSSSNSAAATASGTPSTTAAVTASATSSSSPSSSNSAAATASRTPSTTAAVTASATSSSSPSSSNTAAATASGTPSTTAAVTASATSSVTSSIGTSSTTTPSSTGSTSSTHTATISMTAETTATSSNTPASSVSATTTASGAMSPVASAAITTSPLSSVTASSTPPLTVTPLSSVSVSATTTSSPSPSDTATPLASSLINAASNANANAGLSSESIAAIAAVAAIGTTLLAVYIIGGCIRRRNNNAQRQRLPGTGAAVATTYNAPIIDADSDESSADHPDASKQQQVYYHNPLRAEPRHDEATAQAGDSVPGV